MPGKDLIDRLGAEISDDLHNALEENKMSMFGSLEEPVSAHIRSIMIRKETGQLAARVMCVADDGQLLTFWIDFDAPAAVLNESCVRRVHEEIGRLRRGEAPRLDRDPTLLLAGMNHFSSAYKRSVTECLEKLEVRLSSMSTIDKKRRSAGLIGRSSVKRRMGACRKAIFEALDPDVRRIMARCVCFDAELASRLSGSENFAFRQDAARRKAEIMKFADQYPGFALLLRESWSSTRREIDAYGDMLRGVMEDTKLDKTRVRALRQRSVQSLIHAQGGRNGKMRDDWAAFRNHHPDHLRSSKTRQLIFADLVAQRCEMMMGEHKDMRPAFMKEIAKDPDLQILAKSPQDQARLLEDGLVFLHRNVLSPLSGTRGVTQQDVVSLARLMLPKTLAGIRKTSDVFHNAFSISDFNAHIKGDDKSWTSLTREHVEGDVVVREITSKNQLIKQGADQSHCVGGYSHKVLAATSREATLILSIEKAGQILSTAQVDVSLGYGDDLRFHIVQHYAKRNQNPSHEASKALDLALRTFESYLGEDDLKAYAEGIKRAKRGASPHAQSLMGLIQAWPLYEAMLSKRARKLGGLEACMREVGIGMRDEEAQQRILVAA